MAVLRLLLNPTSLHYNTQVVAVRTVIGSFRSDPLDPAHAEVRTRMEALPHGPHALHGQPGSEGLPGVGSDGRPSAAAFREALSLDDPFR